ncbi:hypothetical protein LCGC14_1637250, partial [marine sediment metagenome]
HKTATKTIEQLNSDLETLRVENAEVVKTVEILKKDLDLYRTREAEAERIAYTKRLEKLSKDFEALGQEKTVEQLGKLSTDVISEFESITSMALKTKSEEKLSTVTIPTQSMPKAKTAKIKDKKPEQLSKDAFLKGLCGTLVARQNETGKVSKRVTTM